MTDDRAMSRLLFLSHRIPYPPNKGDKIRSYHMLKYLARHYEVYLGTLIDDEDDWRYTPVLEKLCAGTYFAGLGATRARVRSLSALFSGRALSVRYYMDRGLQEWVDGLLSAGGVERVVVFSSVMAQYVPSALGAGTHKVIDFVDIDSDKWAQYGASMVWPKNWIYRRESDALARYECDVAREYDAGIFVSEAEAKLFKLRVPDIADRILYIDNGVDTDYFSPARSYANPFGPGQKTIVFTGAMDYWPNVDAVTWFVHEIFPRVRQMHGDAWFYIVGARPTPAVMRLAQSGNVKVTGTVDDVRPYLAHAHMAVAPLRVSRGVQNKVLEAMAMAKPVIATSKALQGLRSDSQVDCADDPSEFADRVTVWLDGTGGADRAVASLREHVVSHYNWDCNLQPLTGLLEGGVASRGMI